ncbi:excalibur calcium-binding domain-containing protein [Streptomyces sp. NPDC032940]|uniref:excalibur calcium-binding domain-containing protein n=1 Tax=Streptomyces sp. NPDC032940 TaxID=3155366 RepID=UPI0033F41464
MNLLRKPAAVAVAALALAALPAAAEAHDGAHPFENCSEAYAAGYSDIKEGSEHYGAHLDRDKDGVGCDKPPAGFVPAGDKDADAGEDTGSGTGKAGGERTGGGQAAGESGTDLAETGGDDTTPYIAAGGGAVVLAGGGLLLAVRRRKDAAGVR